MEKDKRNCPEKDKRNLRGHSSFRKMIFREENTPFFRKKVRKIFRIFIFSEIFPRNLIFREFPKIFRGIFREFID